MVSIAARGHAACPVSAGGILLSRARVLLSPPESQVRPPRQGLTLTTATWNRHQNNSTESQVLPPPENRCDRNDDQLPLRPRQKFGLNLDSRGSARRSSAWTRCGLVQSNMMRRNAKHLAKGFLVMMRSKDCFMRVAKEWLANLDY
jgi:hypothetical protein